MAHKCFEAIIARLLCSGEKFAMTANAFARVTQAHDDICLSLCPAAGALYRWLLRAMPAGKPQDVFLQQFAEWSAVGRKRPYCLKHIKRALAQLEEIGLVKRLRKYGAGIFQLVTYHPEQLIGQTELSENKTEKSQSGMEMSETEGSNADAAVLLYRDIEQHITPTHPPVVAHKEKEVRREVANECCLVEREEPVAPDIEVPGPGQSPANSTNKNVEILTEARAAIAPHKLHQGLQKLLLETPGEVVRAAVAAVGEQVARGGVQNPAGLLVVAIRQQWQPVQVPYRGNQVSDEFMVWYGQAVAAGLWRMSPFSGCRW